MYACILYVCVCVCVCAYSVHIYIYPLERNAAAAAKLLQLCLTLCDPTDGSPPGYSIPGILQARILEWVAIAFSTGKE